MPGIVPKGQEAAITFFSIRLEPWDEHAAAIGLPQPLVADVAAKVAAAREAYEAARVARNAARSATVALDAAMHAMRQIGGDAMNLIRASAALSGGAGVYALAQLPMPAAGSRLGAPPMPTALVAIPLACGDVTLSWTCTRQGGTSFTIERATQRPGEPMSPFRLIAASEKAQYHDAALPTGLSSAAYRVRAHRSGGSSGASDISMVFFGAQPAGLAHHAGAQHAA